MSPPLDEFTTALLTLLRGDATEHGPRWVYDAAYDGDPLKPAYPHGILYRIAGGSADPMPDLDARWDEVTAVWQLTAVSNVRNQCERTTQQYRDRLLTRTPSGAWVHEMALPDGWACTDRRPDPVVPGVDRAGDTPRAVFSQPARYLLTFAPTA